MGKIKLEGKGESSASRISETVDETLHVSSCRSCVVLNTASESEARSTAVKEKEVGASGCCAC